MSTTMQDLESSAFNFSEFIHSGVDVRTGSYSTSLSLAGWMANNGNGPPVPLNISFDSFRTVDIGWGKGWSLSLSSYNRKTRKLTLASGVSYRVYITKGRAITWDKKLQNTRVSVDGDNLIVSHKDGMIEVLSRPDESYDEWLPERVHSNEGRSVNFTYSLIRGRRVLRTVSDSQQRAVLLEYETPNSSPSITLWPDHPQRRLKFVFWLRDGWLRKISLDEGPTVALSWSFNYQAINGFLVMKEVRSPGGNVENIEYAIEGHRLPLGAPVESIPAIQRSVLTPGEGLPTITRDYEYSAKNFLGNQSGLRWTQEGDPLAALTEPYDYTCTERLVKLVKGKAVELSRIERTYNRFHLMTAEKMIAEEKVQQTTVTYHDVAGLNFFDQPANFQLQKTSVVSYADPAADTPPREETTHTTYDDFGNLLTKINPSGAREDYVYYPAEGAEGCPANALGFVSALKERSVTPSSGFALAPTVRVRFAYIDLPSLRTDGHRFLLPQREQLFEGDNQEPSLDTRFEYVNDIGHDFYGRIKKRWVEGHAEKRSLEFEYSIEGEWVKTLQTLLVDGHRHERHVWHDRLTGLEVKARDGAGNELFKVYDRLNRVIRETVASEETSGRSRTIDFLMDSAGALSIDVTSVRGGFTKTWVNGVGQTLKVEVKDVDSPGKPMRLTYEAEYDDAGRLLKDVRQDWIGADATVSSTTYHYDGWGRVCKTVGPDGVAMHDVFDPVSMTRTQWIDGAGKTRSVLNVFGKPDREECIDILGAEEVRTVKAVFSYDGLGRCVKKTSEGGSETRYSYDLFGRLTETILADGTVIKKKYDPLSTGDHPVEIKANDYVLGTRTYDGLMRVTRTTVGGRTTTKKYAGGYAQAIEQVTAAGDLFTFTLSPQLNGAVTARVGGHGQSARFRFDPVTTQLTETASPAIQHRVEYANSGKVTAESWVASDNQFNTATTRSLMGLPVTFTDVNGVVTRYEHDAAARPVHIQQGTVSAKFNYGPQGRLLTLTVEDAVSRRSLTTNLTHDAFGREIKRVSEFGDGTRLEIDQAFGADDKLQKRSIRTGAASRTETFAYDARGRLQRYDCEGTQAPIDAWGKRIAFQQYTYDYLDNLLTVRTGFDGGENLCTFSYERLDRTQVSALQHSHADYLPGRVSFEYDANGNLLNDDQGRRFNYDALSRLERVTGADGITGYEFDAQDQLHAVVPESGELIRLFYNEQALCAEIEGPQRRSLCVKDGTTLAEQQGDDTVLFVTDCQGTPLMQAGSAVESFSSHAPYGDRPSSSGLGSVLGFQGERLDPSTGCYLLGRGYRAYNPRLMRFHSPDSWSPFEDGGVNAYAYCLGDPVNLTDPTGHISTWGWAKIGVTAALAAVSVALTIVTLGGAAPLVPISASAYAWLALETIAATVSISSAVVEELAPDSLGAQILSYSSVALGVVSLGASTVARFGSRGIGHALKHSVDSLEAVATVQRGAARVAVGRRLYGAARASNEAVRRTVQLQGRLNHVLSAKAAAGLISVSATSVFVVRNSDKYARKADDLLQANLPSLAEEFSFQDLRNQAVDSIESFTQEIGDKISTLRNESST